MLQTLWEGPADPGSDASGVMAVYRRSLIACLNAMECLDSAGFGVRGDVGAGTGDINTVFSITESQNGLGWRGPYRSSSSSPLPRAGTPPTRPGCSKPRPAWPWTLPGRGQPQLLWATCAKASPPSQ